MIFAILKTESLKNYFFNKEDNLLEKASKIFKGDGFLFQINEKENIVNVFSKQDNKEIAIILFDLNYIVDLR
jgi:hypothetical protein